MSYWGVFSVLLALSATLVVLAVGLTSLLRGRAPATDLLVIAVAAALGVAVFTTVALPADQATPAVADPDGLSPLEARGRAVYAREGCYYCHTQAAAPQDRGLGTVSLPQEFANQHPNLVGLARIGPDLARVGGKYPDAWLKSHLRDPRATIPGSVMPSYRNLSEEDLAALVAYLQSLGRDAARPQLFSEPKRQAEFEAVEPMVPDAYAALQPAVPIASNTANVGRGIYQQSCAVCHGAEGRGDGPAGATLVAPPTDLTVSGRRSPQYLFWRISEGVPGTAMPRWAITLNAEQRWYLTAYVKWLALTPEEREALERPPGDERAEPTKPTEPAEATRPAEPEPEVPELTGPWGTVPPQYAKLTNPFKGDAAARAAGAGIYQANCATCHGPQGRGDGPAAPAMTPPPSNFTESKYADYPDQFFFWIVSEGKKGTGMPPWKDLLSEEDRWRVVEFLRSFHGR